MQVPLFDPQPQHKCVQAAVTDAVTQVLNSGQFVLGPNVSAFEEEAAAYHGVAHAVSVASGTDALHLALLAAGIGPGDEVITSPFTFIATLEAIYYCGATPIFADIDPETMNLCPQATAEAITERTRAILPVHLFGLSAQMQPLLALAEQHQLKMVGDGAQAFGALYGGHSVGALGDAACFSFFPTKNLGGYGDGGLITTDNEALAMELRTLRNHGSRERYHHHQVGFNSRLDEVQAAALRIKLQHLNAFNDSRRFIAEFYNRELANLPLQLPSTPAECFHVYGQYTVQLHARDELRQALEQRGIGSAIYYPIPLHHQELCRDEFRGQSFPVSERVAQQCLSLPMFPGMTLEQAQTVVSAIQSALTPKRSAATNSSIETSLER